MFGTQTNMKFVSKSVVRSPHLLALTLGAPCGAAVELFTNFWPLIWNLLPDDVVLDGHVQLGQL